MVVRHPELVEKARKKSEEARRYRERLKSRPEALAKYLERKRISSAKATAKRDPEELRAAARERMRRLRSDPAKRAEQSQQAREWRKDPTNAERYRERLARKASKQKARRQSDLKYREDQNAKQRELFRKMRSCEKTRSTMNAKQRDRRKRRTEADPQYKALLVRKAAEWKKKHPNSVREHRARYRQTPHWKAYNSLQKAVIRVVKHGQKQFRTSQYVGIDLSKARRHIESLLQDGWSWENHGKLWHIDHFFPIAKANLDDHVERLAVSNWRNLRPLSKSENLRKKDKVTPEAAALFESLKQEIRATCQN